MKKKAHKQKHYSNKNTFQDSLKSILKQSLLILFISVIGEGITGFILTGMKSKLATLPGLLILVPALTDLRGNVGAAFGERLSTMLHLGIVKPVIKVTNIIKHNILASLTLTIAMAFTIGIIAPYVSKLFHITSIGALRLSMISTSAGIVSSVILLPVVFVLVFFSFTHHIDPDNIIAPMLPVIGDIITVSAIFLSTILVTKLLPISSIGFIFLAALPFLNGFRKKSNKFPKRYHYAVIIEQSAPILTICLTIGIISGIFLQGAEKTFSIYPALLSLVPQVIAQGGSIGGIVGSRVSTALYLGSIRPFQFNGELRKNFTAGILMGLAVAPIIAIVSTISSLISRAVAPPFTEMFIVSFLSLFLLAFLMSIIAVLLAFFSFKIGIDPSNTVIPLITSIGDITGVVVLLIMIKIFIL